MKRLALLVALASCGPDFQRGPSVPLSVTIDGAGSTPPAMLQVILAAPSTEFDPLSHPQQCTKSWIAADKTLQITGSDGKSHPSAVINLSSASNQTVSVSGIPPAKQVLLIVEAISSDHKLIGSGFKSPIAEISAGDNPAVSVTVTSFAPVDCGPLY